MLLNDSHGILFSGSMSNDTIDNDSFSDLDADEYQTDLNEFVSNRLFLTVPCLFLIIFGVLSNIVSVILLNKHHTSTNIYLCGVCISSVIALVGFFINYVLYNLFIYFKYLFGILGIMRIYPYIYPFTAIGQVSFVFLTVSYF